MDYSKLESRVVETEEALEGLEAHFKLHRKPKSQRTKQLPPPKQ
jgi:hypothetical protein